MIVVSPRQVLGVVMETCLGVAVMSSKPETTSVMLNWLFNFL